MNKKIRTVGDLKKYMADSGLNPEKLSPLVHVSNMTIRRILRNEDTAPIPQKYSLQFGQLLQSESLLSVTGYDGFESVLDDLEKSGSNILNIEDLNKDLKKKLTENIPGASFRSNVMALWKLVRKAPKMPARYRWIAIGALLYFINPFDFIPDAIPGVGYVDDFAVLTIATSFLISKGVLKN